MSTARRPRVLVYAPQWYEAGFKQRQIDGDALAVHAHLHGHGFDSTLLDTYYRGTGPAPALADVAQDHDAIVVHLWTSDAYGPRLEAVAAHLAQVRNHLGIPVVAFGPLAVNAAADLTARQAIDTVITDRRIIHHRHLPLGRTRPGLLPQLVEVLQRFHTDPMRLQVLGETELRYSPHAVVSIAASRGCRGRCTFCAYNSDLHGWTELPIEDVVADIGYLHRATGASRFALSDSDFGGTPARCRDRAQRLRAAVQQHGLLGRIRISVNVRPETLDAGAVAELAAAGVATMLIGVESFEPHTLHRLYGKRQNLDHLLGMVHAADQAGITVVASYILWHPWQTPDSLRRELTAIEEFGPHRIPQFLTRSRLKIIPGTPMERRIRAAGLLQAAPFHRDFRIDDPTAADIHDCLTQWFTAEALPVLTRLSDQRRGDLDILSSLKLTEQRVMADLVARATPG